MENDFQQFIRTCLESLDPLQPKPTGLASRLCHLTDIRAVLFDIYGTLLVSASGDVDTIDVKTDAAAASLAAAPVSLNPQDSGEVGEKALTLYREAIRKTHEKLRKRGMPYPEVDVVEIWKTVTEKLENMRMVSTQPDTDYRRCAFAFEILSNPVSPMPHMLEILNTLKDLRYSLGIVSNAQFFSPVVLNYFLTGEVILEDEVAPFDPELTFYSYRYQRAKPDPYLFRLAERRLKLYGISTEQAVYVGNDMRNDILAAKSAGFKTVLFAGDERSLRLRESEEEAGLQGSSAQADAVVTSLAEIPAILTRFSHTL